MLLIFIIDGFCSWGFVILCSNFQCKNKFPSGAEGDFSFES